MSIKTKAQVLREYPAHKTLINAVIRRIGRSSVEDVINHGIDGGFNGFVYYDDTHRFAMRHRRDIIKLLEDDADSSREDVVTMIKNFGVFRRDGIDKDELKNLYRYLGYSKCEQDAVTNVIAWYVAETVCRFFDK